MASFYTSVSHKLFQHDQEVIKTNVIVTSIMWQQIPISPASLAMFLHQNNRFSSHRFYLEDHKSRYHFTFLSNHLIMCFTRLPTETMTLGFQSTSDKQTHQHASSRHYMLDHPTLHITVSFLLLLLIYMHILCCFAPPMDYEKKGSDSIMCSENKHIYSCHASIFVVAVTILLCFTFPEDPL